MRKEILSILISLIMIAGMTPVFSFATEGDETDPTETVESTQPVEMDEVTEPAEADEVTEPEAADETVTPADQEEPEPVFEAKGDDAITPLEPDHPGAARVENIGQYGKSMKIYGIYLKRKNGSADSGDEYGDAVLIESNGKYLLMDCGSNSLSEASGSHPF